jgi:Flp pilus assembly protein TadG
LGTTAVEFAVTAPIVFFVILGTMIGAQGTFRYQQVAALAREGARWASVHGGLYEQETGQPAATAGDVFTSAIEPKLVGLNPSQLTCQVSWDESNMPLSVDSDVSSPTGNTVTVTLTYQWFPELFLLGPISLTSTSTAQMVY